MRTISRSFFTRRPGFALSSIVALTLGLASASAAQAPAAFKLTSSDVKPGATLAMKHVFNGMGCTGQNISPALSWTGAPRDTKSFALTVYDPDAPTGSGWWHWMVYNLPATATSVPSGAGDPNKPTLAGGGSQGPTDFGKPGWGGPCPPPGDKPHRYVFTIYALKVDRLDIPVGATSAYVGFNIHGNMIGKASFTAMYGR